MNILQHDEARVAALKGLDRRDHTIDILDDVPSQHG